MIAALFVHTGGAAARAAGAKPVKRLSKIQNLSTPPAFRDVLIQLAEHSRKG